MSGDFVDTNVLVYVYDRDEPEKQRRAQALLESCAAAGTLVLSTQVLQEFYVAVTRKLSLPATDAFAALEAFSQLPAVVIEPTLVRLAAETSLAAKLSFWDALILESAAARQCERLLTEDLQDGFEWKGVRVENPFA